MVFSTLATLACAAAPALGRLFAGDKGEEIGEGVKSIASNLTGNSSEEKAVAALEAHPELMLQFNAQINAFASKKLEEETKQLQAINETMRQELHLGASVKNFWEFLLVLWKSGWRPAWGWVSCFAWAWFVISIMRILTSTINKGSLAELPSVVTALASAITAMMPIFGMALAVLGVAVLKRSSDKKAAAGLAQGAGGFNLSGATAALGSIMSKVRGK